MIGGRAYRTFRTAMNVCLALFAMTAFFLGWYAIVAFRAHGTTMIVPGEGWRRLLTYGMWCVYAAAASLAVATAAAAVWIVADLRSRRGLGAFPVGSAGTGEEPPPPEVGDRG